MIRINLLGQSKPKTSRRQVDTGAALPVLFIGAGLVFGCLILGYLYYSWQRQLSDENNRIKQLQAQKTDLEQIKLQVESFEKQKQVLQQRVSTIEQLQRDRTGGQELLDQIANTVARTENLWLTSMVKKGNNLALEGAASSINGVANFVTALKRSGYFQKVEIRESKQDEKSKDVQTFTFQMTAEVSPPAQTSGPAARPAARPASAPTQPAPSAPAPAKKG
jgi:type IV pilus assembly protein PilN